MIKNLNFNFWILLLVIVVFFSSSSIAYAKPSDTSDSSHSSSSGSGPSDTSDSSHSSSSGSGPSDTSDSSHSSSVNYYNLIKDVQIGKNVNSSATNYMLFKYRGLYYVHISEYAFTISSFTYELIQRTSIKTSGWWFTCSTLSREASDWSSIPWSSDNYSMLHYETNYITYSGDVVVNFRLDQDKIQFLYCSQDIEGFCVEGNNEPEEDDTEAPVIDYTEQHETIIDKISNIPDAIVNGIKNLFIPDKDYFSNKLKSVESKYLGILGFSVDDFEAMLMGFSKETPITDVIVELNIGGNMQEVNVLNSSVVVQGVNYFRPYIRGFVVLLMVFFSMNQLMHLFKINSISGSTNDTDKK